MIKVINMKTIKTLLLFLFLSIGIQKSFSQTYKFEATGFSVMEKDTKGAWGSWSELQPVNIVITLDTDKNRIIVYSKKFSCTKFKITNKNKITKPTKFIHLYAKILMENRSRFQLLQGKIKTIESNCISIKGM